MPLDNAGDLTPLSRLLSQSAAGDDNSFAELYDRTISVIWPFILAQTGRIDYAAAVTRLVYAAVHRWTPHLPSDRGLCAWSTILALTRHHVTGFVSTQAEEQAKETQLTQLGPSPAQPEARIFAGLTS